MKPKTVAPIGELAEAIKENVSIKLVPLVSVKHEIHLLQRDYHACVQSEVDDDVLEAQKVRHVAAYMREHFPEILEAHCRPDSEERVWTTS